VEAASNHDHGSEMWDMEVIFLAAGLGRRMREMTRETPKPLVMFDGRRSILDANIDACRIACPRSKAVVVGGHQWSRIAEFAANKARDGDIGAVFNPAYESSGPLRSVGVGLRAVSTSSIAIANGDTLFTPSVFAAAANGPRPGAGLVVSQEMKPEDDDMRALLSPRGTILAARKEPGAAGPAILSAGLLVLHGAAAIDACRQTIASAIRIEAQLGRSLPWHSVIADLNAVGVPVLPIPIARDEWQEFDCPECIERFTLRFPPARAHRKL
jgi:choline kinase